MDPRKNPYAPGAGTPPPELAGRDAVIETAAIALDRIRDGRSAQSVVLYGLRGVGKTVLLNRIQGEAEARGLVSVKIEAPEGRSLPAALAPALRSTLLRLNRAEATKAYAKRALQALAGFAKALKLKYNDIEVGLEYEVEPGLADSGDLDNDLTQLLEAVGEAAKANQTAVVLYIDELQYVAEDQLASLISALHAANQKVLPISMVAAGLPQLLQRMGVAKSYAERLFKFTSIDRLDDAAAKAALCVPAEKENVAFTGEAVREILAQTKGYPYFLQEWGKHSWDIANASPISGENALQATQLALAELDNSFFRVRYDRLTPVEKNYMKAMSDLGAGPHRSGDIAEKMGRSVASVAPVRSSLIAKGMVYSPAHGDTAFTVPLFDAFMRRMMGNR